MLNPSSSFVFLLGYMPGHMPGHMPSHMPGHMPSHMPSHILSALPSYPPSLPHDPIPGHMIDHILSHMHILSGHMADLVLGVGPLDGIGQYDDDLGTGKQSVCPQRTQLMAEVVGCLLNNMTNGI